mmetsp:Transcript_29574/g.53892  ORF Transcript_29574/g.53892 Transcript_29574/m.53892 type:complete len:96 (+) Transcript_29574:824-1111(+)
MCPVTALCLDGTPTMPSDTTSSCVAVGCAIFFSVLKSSATALGDSVLRIGAPTGLPVLTIGANAAKGGGGATGAGAVVGGAGVAGVAAVVGGDAA